MQVARAYLRKYYDERTNKLERDAENYSNILTEVETLFSSGFRKYMEIIYFFQQNLHKALYRSRNRKIKQCSGFTTTSGFFLGKKIMENVKKQQSTEFASKVMR